MQTYYIYSENEVPQLGLNERKTEVPVNVQFETGRIANMFDQHDSAVLSGNLIFIAQRSIEVTVTYQLLFDAYSKLFPPIKKELSLIAGDTALEVTFPEVSGKFGVFRLTVCVHSNNTLLCRKRFSFSRALLPEAPNRSVGLSVHLFAHARTEILELLKKIGIGSIRDDISWGRVEKEKGVIKPFPEYDITADAVKRLGTEPLLILNYGNGFYDNGKNPHSDEAISAFARFCYETAKHYRGIISKFEIFNEYNLLAFNPERRDQADYTSMLKAAYKAIKTANPDAVVCTAGTCNGHPAWLKGILDCGAYEYFDAVGIHPYCSSQGPVYPDHGRVREEVEEYRKIIRNYGKEKPVTVTEIGWKTNAGGGGGCAPDCVCLDMEYRYRKASDCADIVTEDTLSDIAANLAPDGMEKDGVQMLIYNPLLYKRDAVIRITGDLPDNFSGGFSGDGIRVQTVSSDSSSIFMDSIWEVPTIMKSTHKTAYIYAEEIPACGYKAIALKPDTEKAEKGIGSGSELENEYLKVTVNRNGTADVLDKESGKLYKNLNYLSSQGEIGNAWQHKSLENDRIFTSENACAKLSLTENGPLSATIKAEYSFKVPKECIENQSGELCDITVTVEYTLQKNSRNLNIRVQLNNTASDHWLRANFPTDINAEYSYSDSHFDVVKRPVKVPDSTGWVEKAYGMQPLRTFAALEDEKGIFSVMPKGLYEYEVFEDTRMALTLIRGCRIKQAVSEEKVTVLEDKGILCLGERSFEYSLGFTHTNVYELCNEATKLYAPPFCAFAGRGKGKLPCSASLLSADNGNIHISAVKPAENGKGIIIRLFNPTDTEQKVNLTLGFAARLYFAGMDETVREEINGVINVPHKKIITVYAETENA